MATSLSASAATRSFFSNEEEDYLWRIVIDEMKSVDESDEPDEQLEFQPANPLTSKFWRVLKQKNEDLTRSTNTYCKKFKRMWLRQEVERLSDEDVEFLTGRLGRPKVDQANAEECEDHPKHYALFGDNAIMDAAALRDPQLYHDFVDQTQRVNSMLKEVMVELGFENPPPPPSVNGEPLPKKRRIFSTDEERRIAARERHRAYGRKRKFLRELRSQALPRNESSSGNSSSSSNGEDLPTMDHYADEDLLSELVIQPITDDEE